MTNYGKMVSLKNELVALGHKVEIPSPVCCRHEDLIEQGKYVDTYRIKQKYNFINKYYENIVNCDAILIANYTKNGIDNYVGGNSFLEIGFAHILGKRIFMINHIPKIPFYFEEIKAMKPIILDGNLKKIK